MDGSNPKSPNFDDGIVFEDEVVARKHGRVFSCHTHFVASIPNRRNCLDMVPMTMGFHDRSNAQALTQFEKLLMFVRRIDNKASPVSVHRTVKTLFS